MKEWTFNCRLFVHGMLSTAIDGLGTLARKNQTIQADNNITEGYILTGIAFNNRLFPSAG